MLRNLKIIIIVCYIVLGVDILMTMFMILRNSFRIACYGGIGAFIMVALLIVLYRFLRLQRIINSNPYDEDDE